MVSVAARRSQQADAGAIAQTGSARNSPMTVNAQMPGTMPSAGSGAKDSMRKQ